MKGAGKKEMEVVNTYRTFDPKGNLIATDTVVIPDWKETNEEIGKQIAECLDYYKIRGKPVIRIVISAGEWTEVEYYDAVGRED